VTRRQAWPHRATRGKSVAKSDFPLRDPRNKPTRPTLRQREAERDKGRGVVDQALALEHNQDPAREVQFLGYCHCTQLLRLCRER
jgi:hypothetical protein